MAVLVVLVGILVWAGATLLIDDWLRRRNRRPTLSERLEPFQPSVAEEAQDWLSDQ
jgi:hypothetical protein